ncbi:MAG: signal peptidase I [Patescibacteria group bacterium]
MLRKLIRLALVAGLTFLIFKFWLLPVRITGLSMEPTYHNGQLILVNHLAYLWRSPARGDVVAVRTSGLRVMYLKRVIGLPGEKLEIKDGVVLIDGQPLTEPYLEVGRKQWQIGETKLNQDEYYVIGDNRQVEATEHLFGRVLVERISGRALW